MLQCKACKLISFKVSTLVQYPTKGLMSDKSDSLLAKHTEVCYNMNHIAKHTEVCYNTENVANGLRWNMKLS